MKKHLPDKILVSILRILQKAGFSVSEIASEDYCFEVVAKKGDQKLLIKTSENIDNERKESADDLKSMAAAYSAAPLVIGSRAHSGVVERGILYERYGVNVMSPETFSEAMLEGQLPSLYSKRGGLYFRIDGAYLRHLREGHGESLGGLAKRVGVSRKAVYEYENCLMGATPDTVAKIEDVFETGITCGIDIFEWRPDDAIPNRSPSGPVARELHGKLKEMGCKPIIFNHAPVDLHAKNMGVSFIANEKGPLDRRVDEAVALGKLLEVEPVLVTETSRPRDIDITVVRLDDVKKIESLKAMERLLDLENTGC